MSSDSNIFDKLLSLKDDPDAFERERKKNLEEEFSKLPEKYRLKAKQQQWKIEGELRKYKDPIARLNKMMEMLWMQFNEFNSLLQGVKKSLKGLEKE